MFKLFLNYLCFVYNRPFSICVFELDYLLVERTLQLTRKFGNSRLLAAHPFYLPHLLSEEAIFLCFSTDSLFYIRNFLANDGYCCITFL